MKLHKFRRCTASTIIIVLVIIACLSASVAAYFKGLIPKYRGTHQSIAWQEALHGAEAGADFAIDSLNTWAKTVTNADAYPWTTDSWAITDPTNYPTNGERTLDLSGRPVLGGPENVRVTKLAVDIYTREGSGTTPTYNPWYRIRSTARADLPNKFVSSDTRDGELRRMKLSAKTSGGLADPQVTRTVEVIVRPRYRASRAITTVNDMTLGNSSNWAVDSFDSQDTLKSNPGTTAGGVYPGMSSSKTQSNGNIASAKVNAASTPYAALISGNGAAVKGEVKTNGGDDPLTATHENVSGNSGMDQSRILSNFDEDILTPAMPTWTTMTYTGAGPASYVTGTKASPTRYNVTGGLGSFAVTAPASGTGYIEIRIAGNLSTGNGGSAGITIPPSVYATIWVGGNIDFGNGNINSDASSSKVATHLTVYGVSTSSAATFSASGNARQILSFNGPNYSADLNGTVETAGSFVVKNFSINGGGNGGFHYDEEIGRNTSIAGWDIASYQEDVRGDL